MAGKEVGNIISHQGLFPSIHPEVENVTAGKPFVWIGWDFIYSHDMGQLLQDCETWFRKGRNIYEIHYYFRSSFFRKDLFNLKTIENLNKRNESRCGQI